jgi:hypothetical protein
MRRQTRVFSKSSIEISSIALIILTNDLETNVCLEMVYGARAQGLRGERAIDMKLNKHEKIVLVHILFYFVCGIISVVPSKSIEIHSSAMFHSFLCFFTLIRKFYFI